MKKPNWFARTAKAAILALSAAVTGAAWAELPGSGTEDNPYTIANLDALKEFRDSVNAGNTYSGKSIKLTSDIDLNNEEWEPIGGPQFWTKVFSGNFDGDGHTVSNLKVVKTASGSYAGFFGHLEGGSIRNLTIHNADVSGVDNCGAVVGLPYTGTVDNCKVTGLIKITASGYDVGGIAGGYYGIYGTISNCEVSGKEGSSIYGKNAGGIAGYLGEGVNGGKIISCKVDGVRIGTPNGSNVAGIIGMPQYMNIISNCTVGASTVIVSSGNDSTRCGLVAGRDLSSAAKGLVLLVDNIVEEGAVAKLSDETPVEVQMAAHAEGATAYAIVGKDIEYDSSKKIIGGQFEQVPESALADGYILSGPNAEGYYTLEEAPKGTITVGYVNASRGVWGEADSNAKKSFSVKVYSGETLLGTTTLNNIGGIIDGSVNVTWSALLPSVSDEYWTTAWEEDGLAWNKAPTKVELWVDGVKVAENVAQLNGPDGINPVKWWQVAGVSQPPISVVHNDVVVDKCGTIADALAVAQSGDVVSVSAGEFELKSTAVIPAGVALKGAGKDATTFTISTTNGDGVKITNPNVTISDATINGSAITSSGYNSLINVEADGVVIDSVVMTGGGKSTWNSSILVESLTSEQTFTVKNSTISGSFRGVLRESCSANIVIKNCDIDAVYPFNIDGGNGGTVTVVDSALHGWTSYGGVDSVTFTNCEFSKANSGYDSVAAYVDTTFDGCTFDSNFEIKPQTTGFTFELEDCTKNGVALTWENMPANFGDANVWNKCTCLVDHERVAFVAQIGDTVYNSLDKAIAAAVAAVPADGTETTIKMIADEVLSGTVTIPAEKNVVLDLNGKTVSGSATVLNVAGTLVIDGTTSGSGISSTGDETIVVNGGTLTVDGGSYMTTGNNKYVFRVKNSATVTIDGCTTECAEGSNLKGFLRADGGSEVVINDAKVNIGCQYYVLDSRGGSTITVKGGSFVKHDGREYQQFADMKQGNIAIEGGSFTFNYTGAGIDGGAPELFLFNTADADDGYTEGGKSVLTISGGTFTGLWNNASLGKENAVIERAIAYKNTEQACEVYVSGGTYNYNPENWVGWETGAGTASNYPFNAEGYKVVDNNNNTYTVVSAYEAQIVRNGAVVQKGTLSAMVEAAQDGDTVMLLKDVELALGDNSINIFDKSIVLDLSGHTITATEYPTVFYVGNTGSLTIYGNKADANNPGGIVKTCSSGYIIKNYSGHLDVHGGFYTISGDTAITCFYLAGDYNTISDATIRSESENTGAYAVEVVADGTAVLTNCKLYSKGGYAVTHRGSTSGTDPKSLTATGCEFSGKNGAKTTSFVYALFENCTFNVEGIGVYGKNNKTYKTFVKDCQITCTKTEVANWAVRAATIQGTENVITVAGSGSALYSATVAEDAFVKISADNISKSKSPFNGMGLLSKDDLANVTLSQDRKIVDRDPSEADYATYPYAVVYKANVAQIGTIKYETLAEAVAAAQDGETIQLLADVSLTERLFVNAGAEPAYAGSNNRYATTSENKGITLDLNGKNITSASNIALAGGSLNITGTGTISTTGSGLAPIEVRGTGDLANKRTLTIGAGVTLNGDYGLNVFGSNDAQKNIIDVTVDGTVYGTLFVLGNLKNTENAINIVVNGTVAAKAGTSEDVNVGIALNGNANVTVNNGATVSGDSGIEVRAGNLTVNGGTISATSQEYSYKPNGSGSTTKGAAIAVAQHGTLLPTTATLNGGTLSGTKQIAVTDVNGSMDNVSVVATQGYTQSSAIPDDYKWVETETASVYTLAPKSYVAQIVRDDKVVGKYETLQAAVDAAQAGDTVELLKDVDLASGYVSINKALTLAGDFEITSSAAQAVLLTGSGDVTIMCDITASKGHGVQAGSDEAAYSGKLTVDGATITVAKRGIRVYEEDTGFGIVVKDAVIQSNVADPKTTYTTGNDAMALSLGAAEGKGYSVVITDSVLQGFSYCINSVTSGCNLTVEMNGGATYGRAALNVWGSNNAFTLAGVEVHGLNNQTGPTEGFACIVENTGAKNNTYNINGCTFVSTLSSAAASASGSSATEQMIDLRGTQATVKITGETTYTAKIGDETIAPTSDGYARFGLISSANSVSVPSGNSIDLDSSASASLADVLTVLPKDVDTDVSKVFTDGTSLGYVPEVLYYWATESGFKGGYYDFNDPFDNGWLAEGEYIDLYKATEMDKDVSTTVSFTLNLKGYTLTAGSHKIRLGANSVVTSDTEGLESVFAAPDATYFIAAESETTGEQGAEVTVYTYRVMRVPSIVDAANSAAVLSADLPSGYSLKRSVDGGDWTEVQSTEIALGDLPGSGAAKTYEFKAVKGGSEIAIANTVGILHVADTVKSETTVIAVPWQAFGEKITVDSLVYLGNRSDGDQLMAYDATSGTYYSWTLKVDGSAKTWKPDTTVKTGSEADEAPAASEFPISRGQGVFLKRTNVNEPIYLVGRAPASGETVAVTTTLAAGSKEGSKEKPAWTLVAAPSTAPLDLNDPDSSPFGAENADDTIMLVSAGGVAMKIPYTYKNGQWGRPVSMTVEETRANGKTVKYTYTERSTEGCTIPAGTGFWYLNKGGEKTVEW